MLSFSVNKTLTLLLLPFVVLSACTSPPVQQKLLKSMADLDAALIPPIILTQLGKQEDSKIAMERLKSQWDNFYETYYPLEMKYGVNIVDKLWKSNLNAAKGLIASAEAAVKLGSLSQATAQLGKVENIFREIRRQHGLPYILDDMLDFSDAIKEIETRCAQKKLNERDFAQLRQTFDQAGKTWEKICAEPINGKLFGFTPEKVKALKKKIRAENTALEGLSSSIYAANKEAILSAAAAIQNDLVQIIRAFGDFNPIIEKVKQEKKRSSRK
ncbi:MAG: hypothetical protein QME05_04915 [Candidatus Margulisbacteria bacterium]|nr:hypothetical protein [Candidatus Margulisiibacteriota bacterium]